MKNTIKFLAIAVIAILGSCSKSNDSAQQPTKYVVTTLAGIPGIQGDINGNATVAKLFSPVAIAVEGNGTVYVGDNNHKIKTITPAGVVSSYIGSTQGDVDGVGANAKLNSPAGLVFNNGFLTISHRNNIKNVSVLGGTTTFIGSSSGNNQLNGTAAKLSYPSGICYDTQGNLYVADSNNHVIKKYNSSGAFIASTITNSLLIPLGICIYGNYIYVASWNTDTIVRFDLNLTNGINFAGSTVGDLDGNGINARLNGPKGICVDSQGNLYVTDSRNCKIKKITPNGDVVTISGNSSCYAEGNGITAKFNYPSGIYYFNNKLYVSDTSNHCIRVISNL